MLVCPLCEHAQASGTECDECGRALGTGGPPDAPVEALLDLERTAQESAAGAPPGEPFLETLEATAFASAGAVAADEVPELEATRTAPVEVAADPVLELESHLADRIAEEAPPLLAGATCRYCRSEAPPGEVYCGRCGMRLPRPAGGGPGPASAEPAVLLCSCGLPVSGARCPACGARRA